MTLTLYNTLTRRKEPFRPIDPRNVRIYVCGPTVYDFAHIGNARPIIVFDVLFRLLRHLAMRGEWDGGKGQTRITYARNITDVDDKINARAAAEYPDLPLNEAIRKVTEKTTEQFHADIAALGVLTPADVNIEGQPPLFMEPRATAHIAEMRALCEALVAKGHAYVAQDHVLFDVGSMSDYGRLANRSLEEMEAGARVDVAPYKKGPMDFVLWKPSKPGEPAWPSLKGIAALGRPGWHIECSAMADKCLWDEPRLRGLLSEAGLNRPHVFDIHGGGIDLVFPHHENEIAQSRCGHGTDRMANIWMHNGFLQVEGEKMSKSLGNFVTIRELLREWPGDVIRLQMLMTHYTQPLDWTAERCKEAARELQYWGNDVASLFGAAAGVPSKELVVALADDLNTPQAITVLRDRATKAKKGDVREARLLAEDCKFLGLRNLHLPGLFESGVLARDAEQRDLIAQRDRVQGLRAALANNDVDLERQHRLDIEQGGFRIEVHQRGNITLLGVDKAFTARVSSRVAARNAARKAKNFQEADRIRDELSAMGIQLKDAKDPATGEINTTWEVKG